MQVSFTHTSELCWFGVYTCLCASVCMPVCARALCTPRLCSCTTCISYNGDATLASPKSIHTHHTHTHSLTHTHSENNVMFREYLKRLESHKRCQNLSMQSFLLLPMQRITRMPLLILAILNRTPLNHPDHQIVEQTLRTVQKVCVCLVQHSLPLVT